MTEDKYVCGNCKAEYDSPAARVRCELECDEKQKAEAERERRRKRTEEKEAHATRSWRKSTGPFFEQCN